MFAADVNRRAFLKCAGTAGALCLPAVAWAATGVQGPAPGELLSQARQNIEKFRKSDGVIVVRQPDGKPANGVRVSLEQTRHAFLFGCNLFMLGRAGDLEGEYRDRFAAMFNFCTLGFYWANYEAERGRPNYAYTDQAVAWARQQGITCKGHPLVWDHPASSPRWLPESDLELKRASDGRVREIVARFHGRIDAWDVVNEATHLPDKVNQTRMARWGASLGNVAYTRDPLKVAREAGPSATLLVNDYRTGPDYHRLLESLKTEERSLFDVVGIQSHMHDGRWPLARIWQICDAYQDLNLPIHFTETTILSGKRSGPGENWSIPTPAEEEKQAVETLEFYTMLFGHRAVQAITWWDFSDRGAWQRAPAGWLRADMSRKPVYDRMLSLIQKEWRTQAEGRTGEDGTFSVRAFHGKHRVTIEAAGGKKLVTEVAWEPGKPNRPEITI